MGGARNYLLALAAGAALLLPIAALAADPPASECVPTRSAAEYCKSYSFSPNLAGDSSVQRAKRFCEGFYTEVKNTIALFCAYKAAGEQLHTTGAAAANKVDSTRVAQATGNVGYDVSGNTLGSFRGKALRQITALQENFKRSESALQILAKAGKGRLDREVHCQGDGVPGVVPGFFLVGLSAKSLSDQQEVYDEAHKELIKLYETAGQNESSARQAAEITASRVTSSGAVGGAVKPPQARHGHDDIRAPRAQAGFSPFLQQALGKLLSLLERAYSGTLDPAGFLNIGISLVGVALKVSMRTTVILAVASYLIESSLREQMNQKEEKQIFQPYLDWGKANGAAHASSTSDQMAKAYRSTKEAAPYCGTCRVVNADCPGFNRFNQNYNEGAIPPSVIRCCGGRMQCLNNWRYRRPTGCAPNP